MSETRIQSSEQPGTTTAEHVTTKKIIDLIVTTAAGLKDDHHDDMIDGDTAMICAGTGKIKELCDLLEKAHEIDIAVAAFERGDARVKL